MKITDNKQLNKSIIKEMFYPQVKNYYITNPGIATSGGPICFFSRILLPTLPMPSPSLNSYWTKQGRVACILSKGVSTP